MAIALGVALLVLVGVAGFVLSSNSDDDTTESEVTTTSQSSETSTPATDDEPTTPEATSNIVELAQATDTLSTLVTAVVEADLVDTLSSTESEFTVFAPTNDAFDALPEGTLETLLAEESKAQLTDILTYHVVANEVFSDQLTDGQVIETVQGDTLTVSIADGVVKINGATVLQADVDATNGVVHVIDSVLLPQ